MPAMKRIRTYLEKSLNSKYVKDTARLASLGITCRYFPDPPEDFDEFEFVSSFKRKDDLGIMVTVERGIIRKIFFGLIDPEDPDIIKALSKQQLKELFKQSGERLIAFFNYISGE
jgi:hypothetical protein